LGCFQALRQMRQTVKDPENRRNPYNLLNFEGLI